jgi:carboxypeptidase T
MFLLLFNYCRKAIYALLIHFSKIYPNFTGTYSFSAINRNSLLVLITLLLSFSNIAAQQRYSNLKIYFPKDDLTARYKLLELLEVDHYHENNGSFMYTVDQEQIDLLKKNGYSYDIIDEDAIATLERKNQEYYDKIKQSDPNSKVAFERSGSYLDDIIPTPSAFTVQPTLGGYYRFGQMDTAMTALVSAYPAIAQKFSIGNSVEGRPLWCIKISDNVASDELTEPEVLYMGLHHAREAISGSSMIFFMQYLCENYATDSRIKDLVDNRQIYIIPCSNPDGWEFNRSTFPTGGGQWRKNRRVNGSGQFGVDLNRNWGIDFANCTGALGGTSNCGSSIISSAVYWGPSQYSEPETRNLRAFVRARRFVACMDQHSVGPYYSLPWGRLTRTMTAADQAVYTQMSSVMGKYNGMRYGNTYQTLGYEVSGGMKDLLLRGTDSLPNGKCYGMTGEGSNGTSATNFWPLAAEIVSLCKGMVYQNIQLLYTAGSYVDLQDVGPLHLKQSAGRLHFTARRIGLANQQVTVSVIPIQNIASVGTPVIINTASLPSFNSIYADSIAYTLTTGITDGSIVKYVWSVQTGGYTFYDTVTCVYRGVDLIKDEMEGALATTNWTVTGSWAYTNDEAYAGSKSLGESSGINYTASAVHIAEFNSGINLSGATDAFLSFWVKYRAENFRDLLRVEVSADGTTWTPLSGKHTVKEPGTADGSKVNDSSALTGIREYWTREVFNLSAYTGETDLRFRFRFTSDAATIYAYSNDAGFYIDNLSVFAGNSSGSSLPVEMTSFSGKTIDGVNYLEWITQSEINTDRFIIERSGDGKNTDQIGVIAAAGNSRSSRYYTFEDHQPLQGDNLYRLKITDRDESYEYSKWVLLKNTADKNAQTTGIKNTYPNPANDNIRLTVFVAEEQAHMNMMIYSISGQVVHQQSLVFEQGEHTEEIDLIRLPQGTYFIAMEHIESNISYEHKFIKQ